MLAGDARAAAGQGSGLITAEGGLVETGGMRIMENAASGVCHARKPRDHLLADEHHLLTQDDPTQDDTGR